jgi:hypothetical protein
VRSFCLATDVVDEEEEDEQDKNIYGSVLTFFFLLFEGKGKGKVFLGFWELLS